MFETALAGVLTDPIVAKGYDLLMLEEALYEAVGRARTRAGRVENLRRATALTRRSLTQREGVFLVAADVADHEGIAEIEEVPGPRRRGSGMAGLARCVCAPHTDCCNAKR